MRFPILVLLTDLLKIVGLAVVLALGTKSECTSEPLDLFPWLVVAAVVPLFPDVSYVLLVLFALAIYCWDHSPLKGLKKHSGCFNSTFWAIATMVWDLFSVVWLCIGIALVVRLEECPELDAAICGLVYLALLCVRSLTISIVICYKSCS